MLATVLELQRAAFIGLLGVYWISEAQLLTHRRAGDGDRVDDRGTSHLFQAVLPLSYVLAIAAASQPWGSMTSGVAAWTGIALMLVGQLLRWWSVATLGRLFTVNVAIRPEHQVITTGPYRYIRHPSYAALLLLHLGAGLCVGNLFSLLLLTVPITLVLLQRIHVEEAVLSANLGTAYREYAAGTHRLIPGIY